MKNHLYLKVQKIIRQTSDSATFIFENPKEGKLDYQSGQFLTLVLKINNRELRRSYSLNSSPEWEENPGITVKLVHNGEVSRYLLSKIKEGDILEFLTPAGRFTIETQNNQARDIFLIGAGSGITPLFSILKSILKKEPQSKVILIYSNQNEDSILFRGELSDLEKNYPNFRCIHLLSNPITNEWQKYRGRLSNGLLEKIVHENLHFNKKEALFYLCGPLLYMIITQTTLVFMGFPKENIKKENFVTDKGTKDSELSKIDKNAPPKTVLIKIDEKEYPIIVEARQTILDAAQKQGLELPYSCKDGICSTCTGICKSGEVYMHKHEVLTEKDLAQNFILTCTGHPMTEDVVIEIK